jgi:phosphatidylserine/phosphatidylglycerophosphate/cardiolipin synthase-like enzyme
VERSTRHPPPAIEWLIDNGEAYTRLLHAIQCARRSIRIAQLALDADCLAYADPGRPADTAHPAAPVRLADALLDAGARGVDVEILLNTTLLLDTAKPLLRFLRSSGATGVNVRGISRFPTLLHAKIAIVDDREAFLLGSPFVNGYWDDRAHRPNDSRRPLRELGGRPLHDLSVRITGPITDELDATFTERWDDATVLLGERSPRRALRTTMPARSAASTLRLVRTLPARITPSCPDGESAILDACLDGIRRARSLIYIEHQYLSARPIVAALATALEEHPRLEIIAVLNQNPDITAYRAWQNARLAEFRLAAHPRVGLFAMWSTEARADGRVAINQVFVHSKLLAVDDQWATTGSANLDGVSLHSYGDDFERWLGRWVFAGVRNIDVNVVIDETDEETRPDGLIADLRTRLWSEHLGVPTARLVDPPASGWLALWRQRAAANVTALNAPPSTNVRAARMDGFVLPYSPAPTPAEQLADIGVDAVRAGLDICFNPGWLEVHFSPNWVRNMFL